MPTASSRSHSDSWVNEDTPYKNHGKGTRLWLRSGDSNLTRRTFISFARPFPHNDAVAIVSATLKVFARDASAWTGTHVISARRVIETWKENRVNFHNQPDTDPTEVTLTVVAPDDGEELDIDVTTLLQEAVSDGNFFGFRLTINGDSKFPLYSSDAGKEPYHPRLEVEWALPPYPPTDLEPQGGGVIGIATPVLTWRTSDPQDERDQSASQVQISSTTSFTSPAYDSGKQTNTLWRWDTNGETTIPDGATRYWRVRVWDDGDRPSAWSDTAQFSRQSKGTLAFVNPGPSHTVDDLTPDIEWSFTGRTQDRARLRLLKVRNDNSTVELFSYPMSKNDQDHLTLVARDLTQGKGTHPIIKTGENYRVQLYIWDTFDRVATPHDPAYVFAQTDFTYSRSGTPDPVTSLTASTFQIDGVDSPGVQLAWSRASTPDWFTITANGQEILHRVEPLDVFVSPGNYSMVFWEPPIGQSVTYEVEAVEAGNGNSDGNATADLTTSPVGVWLIDDGADDAVQIMGLDQPDFSIGESATTYNPVGNQRPVRITDAVRGYEGSFSGLVTSAASRDTLLDLKGRDKELRMVIAGLNIPIWLEEVSVAPMPLPDRGMHQVSFSFFQTGEFPVPG